MGTEKKSMNDSVTPRSTGLRRLLLAVAGVMAVGVALFVAAVVILLEGHCEQPEHYRISKFRGQVVGRRLGPLQYRWLRRQFRPPAGTKLMLSKIVSEPHYRGADFVPEEGVVIGNRNPDASGAFDFGDLTPGNYSVIVKLPNEDAVEFGFTIDPTAHNADVLIDASPAPYCHCCGWDFEPRQ